MCVDYGTTLTYVDFYVNGLCVLMMIRYDTHLDRSLLWLVYVDNNTTLAYVDVYVNGLCVLMMVRHSPGSILINGLCMMIRHSSMSIFMLMDCVF